MQITHAEIILLAIKVISQIKVFQKVTATNRLVAIYPSRRPMELSTLSKSLVQRASLNLIDK